MSIMHKRKPIATTGTTPFAISDIVQQTNGGIKDLEDKRVESINSINNTKTNSINTINTTTQNNINNIKKEGANQIALATAQAELATQKAQEAVGVAIGTYLDIASNSTYTPPGYLLRDGAEYSKSQFENFYSRWLVGGLIKTVTYTEYNNQVNAYGFCDKFAINTTNQKFRTPLANPINRVLIEKKEPTTENPYWYNLYSDGWCEQGGVTIPSASTANKEVVLAIEYRDTKYQVLIGNEYTATATAVSCVVTSTKTTSGFTISDSKTATYYTYWRTQGYTNQVVEGSTRPYVVVANGELNESNMNWSQWATSLEGKANADLSNCTRPYIIETSDKRLLPSWYKIWSDGWCEQGGIITAGASNNGAEVVLLKPLQLDYSITSYVLGTETSFPNAASLWCKCINRSTTSFYLSSGYTGASSTAYQAYKCSWEARGYIN